MVLLIKCLLGKHEDLSFSPRTHVSKKQGMMGRTCHRRDREVETDRPMVLANQSD